jgi:para-nitrobenzyl esterase
MPSTLTALSRPVHLEESVGTDPLKIIERRTAPGTAMEHRRRAATRGALCVAALLCSGFLFPGGGAFAAARVKTAEGTVAGTAKEGVRVFLGIPYAAPPVGDLRWRAPQPAARWSGVRAATRFAPSCIQGDPVPFGPYTPPFLITPERSEDCLYLNVWSPKRYAAPRPVYLFIHGGGFQSGGASVPVYDGAALARKGGVVVTINYRLGLLGFLAHPELTRESQLGSSGNYGLLDTVAALRWVRTNIARFGGDPENVTIAGQSAGAAAVNALLVSPLAKGLFHRAVIESGPVIGLPMPSLQQAEQAGVALATKLKATSVAELRALPSSEIAKTMPTAIPWPNVDGKVVLADPERGDTPVVSRVPLIVGYNRDERTPDAPPTAAAFEKDLRQRFGALAERALALYPHGSDTEAARSAAELARERYIAALLFWAERRSAQGQPVYGYLFEHVFPGAESARFRAFHTAEVPYIFGAFDLQDVTFTDADRRVSDEMQDRWLAFMRRGNPNSKGGQHTWNQLGGASPSLWRIDPADTGTVISDDRLELFRDYVSQGGRLGLF